MIRGVNKMSDLTNLENINNILNGITLKVSNIYNNVENLPNRIDVVGLNVQSADLIENKVAYGEFGYITGTYENLTDVLNQQSILINGLDASIISNDQLNSLRQPSNKIYVYNTMNFWYSNINNVDILDISECTGLNDKFKFGEFTDMNLSAWNTQNVTSMSNLFYSCENLLNIDVSNLNVVNLLYIDGMFAYCNNLSNESIDSIINMCLNATNVVTKNLSIESSVSPFTQTNITSDRYSSRLSDLDIFGWTY